MTNDIIYVFDWLIDMRIVTYHFYSLFLHAISSLFRSSSCWFFDLSCCCCWRWQISSRSCHILWSNYRNERNARRIWALHLVSNGHFGHYTGSRSLHYFGWRPHSSQKSAQIRYACNARRISFILAYNCWKLIINKFSFQKF